MNPKTDTVQSSAEALRYPWEQHPGPEEIVEVSPGVLWARLKLPFRLNHVNIYLLADGDGYAMIDAGFGNEETIEAWTKTVRRAAEGRQHHAPDRDPFPSRSRRSRRAGSSSGSTARW